MRLPDPGASLLCAVPIRYLGLSHWKRNCSARLRAVNVAVASIPAERLSREQSRSRRSRSGYVCMYLDGCDELVAAQRSDGATYAIRKSVPISGMWLHQSRCC